VYKQLPDKRKVVELNGFSDVNAAKKLVKEAINSYKNILPESLKANTVYINGKEITFQQPPYLSGDNVMIQLKPVMDEFGIQVIWNDSSRSISLKKDSMETTITIDKSSAVHNGTTINLNTAPKIVDSYTMVPLQFIEQVASVSVDFNTRTQTIQISSK
jgi:hypothetical protein